jgi:asparagine synthase (glutamine-hydrolysing)
MCGIAGFFAPNASWNASHLASATNRLAHRGPDAEGRYFDADAGIGLGHRRLSILDLSADANQPMWSHDGRYVAVFNGEIFNYQEIAPQVGAAFRTHSDTEVVLQAFAKWGPDFIHKCNGFFALAIYDKHEQKLWLFRDRMGIKPLYYHFADGRFAFGSELKALRPLLGNLTPDGTAIGTFLHVGYIPAPLTIFQEVKKLPKGTYAVVHKGQLQLQSFWKPEEQLAPHALRNEAEAKQTLKELIVSSVRYRMISDVPLGTFLSGGVDSSLVTAVAQSLSNAPVKTFSIGFDFAPHDESAYAQAVAHKLGTEHHAFRVTQREAIDLAASITDIFDEPFGDASAIPTAIVSALARKHVTVALSGDGGDELFLGYGMYTWARRLHNPIIRALRDPIARVLQATGKDRNVAVAELFRYPNLAGLQAHIFSQDQRFFSKAELATLLRIPHDTFLNQTPTMLARTLLPAESQALFDINNYLPDDLLVKVDRASMLHGLEVRTPLLDYRIAQFALNLHEDLKIRDGVAKYLLKQVLYDYLPAPMFNRPKWGFGVPLRVWLKSELRYMLDEQLHKHKVMAAGFVNPEVVENLKSRFLAGEDHLNTRLWVLAMLHQWHDKFSKGL